MTFKHSTHDNIHILTLAGNMLGEHEGNPLYEVVDEAIASGESKFILDLAEMKYINSMGIGVLLGILTKSRKASGDTIVCNMPESLHKLLVMTKLENIFTTAVDIEEAIGLLKLVRK